MWWHIEQILGTDGYLSHHAQPTPRLTAWLSAKTFGHFFLQHEVHILNIAGVSEYMIEQPHDQWRGNIVGKIAYDSPSWVRGSRHQRCIQIHAQNILLQYFDAGKSCGQQWR